MNFDTPLAVPTPEKGPKHLSLPEVKVQIAKFVTGQEIPGSEKIVGDPERVDHYEIATLDEKGGGALYTYRADAKIGNAVIDVAYSAGDPAQNDWIPGGSNLSKYDCATQIWTDINVNITAPELLPHRTEALPGELVKYPEMSKPEDDASEEEKKKYFENIFVRATIKSTRALFEMTRREVAPSEELLEMIYSSLVALNKAQAAERELGPWNADGELTEDEFLEFMRQFDALPKPAGTVITKRTIKENANKRFEDEPAEQGIEKLEKLFDTAEKILGITDVAELEQREIDMLPIALERRALAKHFADRTMNGILRLNQSYEPYASIKNWNPKGKLTGENGEEKFKALVRRREILIKAIGSWNVKMGGISHS